MYVLYSHGINQARMAGKKFITQSRWNDETLLLYRETNMATIPFDSHNWRYGCPMGPPRDDAGRAVGAG